MSTKKELLAAMSEEARAEAVEGKWTKAKIEASLAPEPDEEDAKLTMAQTLRKARERYVPSTAYSGKKSLDNGDKVAQALRSLSPEDVIDAAERLLELKTGELAERYEGLNPGQRRMNAGNKIRGAIKREEKTAEDLMALLH